MRGARSRDRALQEFGKTGRRVLARSRRAPLPHRLRGRFHLYAPGRLRRHPGALVERDLLPRTPSTSSGSIRTSTGSSDVQIGGGNLHGEGADAGVPRDDPAASRRHFREIRRRYRGRARLRRGRRARVGRPRALTRPRAPSTKGSSTGSATGTRSRRVSRRMTRALVGAHEYLRAKRAVIGSRRPARRRHPRAGAHHDGGERLRSPVRSHDGLRDDHRRAPQGARRRRRSRR